MSRTTRWIVGIVGGLVVLGAILYALATREGVVATSGNQQRGSTATPTMTIPQMQAEINRLKEQVAACSTATVSPTNVPTVTATSTPGSAPTETPAATSTPAPTDEPVSCTPIWGDEDDFSIAKADLPEGDRAMWTVVQVWDGSDVNTTVVLVIAPGMVVRLTAPVQGAKWHVTVDCPAAEAQLLAEVDRMENEVAARDNITKPRSYVIRSVNAEAPYGWVVQAFPTP